MKCSATSRAYLRIAATLLIALPIAGCSLFPWQSSRYGGETSEVFFLDLGREDAREVRYTLRLGGDVADVYFAFVNYGETTTVSPAVTAVSMDAQAGVILADDQIQSRSIPAGPRSQALMPAARRTEPPEVIDFNNNPPDFLPGAPGQQHDARALSDGTLLQPRAGESVGTAVEFYQYDGSFSSGSAVLTRATLRKVVNDELGHALNVWVADDWWEDTDANLSDKVTQDKVDSLSNAFLAAGPDNDIRDWVSTMLGEPWGEHGYSNLLSPSDVADTIDILLVDILRDTQTDQGVIGFFWAKDNYYRTSDAWPRNQSNERVMFYLDAPMYGQREPDNTWTPDQFWPQLVVSTLAHEFQHMIHFYQKNVLRSGRDSGTWLNEMTSMMVEDLVSYRMEIPGPRGVDPVEYPAGTAGAANNPDGWLGYFNANNDVGIFEWDDYNPEPNYAVNYGFGAFLSRSYGGAQFAGALVQNDFIDELAVETALDTLGYRLSFREVLSQWAAAVLVSDEEIVPWDGGDLDAVYNAGEWFESSASGTTYRLGSINLFNHVDDQNGFYQEGPRIYTSNPIADGDSRAPASVVYFQAGASLTGSLEWDINLGANTDLVVVVKAVQ